MKISHESNNVTLPTTQEYIRGQRDCGLSRLNIKLWLEFLLVC